MIILPFVHSLLSLSLQGLNCTLRNHKESFVQQTKEVWEKLFSEVGGKMWAAGGLVSAGSKSTGYY